MCIPTGVCAHACARSHVHVFAYVCTCMCGCAKVARLADECAPGFPGASASLVVLEL